MSAQLEAEKKEYEAQLDLVGVSLHDDPGNTELLALRTELEQMIQLIDDSLAELRPVAAAAPPPPPPTKQAKRSEPAEEQPKWSRENHPAFKKAAAAAAPADTPEDLHKEDNSAPAVYQVNDTVLARWLSGDKGFYPARITSVTGSSTAPIYTVKFKSYGTVETLRGKDIKPVAGAASAAAAAATGQKRKADGGTANNGVSPTTTGSQNDGIVLSAGAELYPHALEQQQAKGDKLDEQGRPKFKKIKAKKELEAGKNKWQEFSAKGKVGKVAKKDSMFRTPEGPKGRVGFTGSGQAMRKDPTRTRHVYQPNEDVD